MRMNGLTLLINNYQIIGLMMLVTVGFLIIWNKKLQSEDNLTDVNQQDKINHKYTYFLSRMDITSAEIGIMIAIGIAILIGLIYSIGWLIGKM
jgi:hypothetical protein